MAGPVPDSLKPYWGPIQAAASQRLGVAGTFDVVRNAMANAGQELTGVDAVAMGQAYSAAVAQRNSAQVLQGLIGDLNAAEGADAARIAGNAITAEMIRPVTPWSGGLAADVMPDYAVQYQVSIDTPQGSVLEYRRIALGNNIPQTVGQINELINSLNEVRSVEYGTAEVPTGSANILTL